MAQDLRVVGEVDLPQEWTVFAPLEKDDPVLAREAMTTLPDEIAIGEKRLKARKITSIHGQYDLAAFLGKQGEIAYKVAYVFLPLHSDEAQEATLGMGADQHVQVWLNGESILDTTPQKDVKFPPSIADNVVNVRLNKGVNILAARLSSGSTSATLAVGGPRDLREGNLNSILADPLLSGDPRWGNRLLLAKPGGKSVVNIGTRRELFVDDFLVDGMTGGAARRLHHPVAREVVLELNKPWEGLASAYFAVVQDGGKIRIYYNARPQYPKSGSQTTCLIESEDGIHFTRPNLGLIEHEGSRENNMVWRRGASGHNFTPFIDANPNAPADQRYKAVAYHPNSKGLGAYGSPDGIQWRLLTEERIISEGGFDSQNLAYWDDSAKRYVCYYRREDPRGRLRGIWRSVSEDFLKWSDPRPLEYADDRMEHMYTNCIRPYFRAPHIAIATPSRYVPRRTKIVEHPNPGVSDAVLMSSRDGLFFNRWEEGFIRPGTEKEVWTDRNHYPAWGMVQLTPEEITMYWTEHYRHPTMRLRRGTIRTDGFVSLHAGGEVGEMLTRPLVFSGKRLEINYATSAIGTVRFELCDVEGKPIKGFALADSEVLFGNELSHVVTWRRKSDLRALAGRPVRLRVRLQDADLYSIRFASEE